jgi:paraquat-inducible protein B
LKRRASPTRIGVFMLGALAVLVSAVVMVSGSGLFASRERAQAYFEGSVYGLQIGAPVVLRGVRLGSVVGIGIVHEARPGQPGQLTVPVEIQIDRARILSAATGADLGASGSSAAPTVHELVQQGLTAQLSMQSLLTGLLYVDLDFGRVPPGAAAAASAPRVGHAAMAVIPTVPTPLQELHRQLQQVDIPRLLTDIAGAAAAARQLLADPKLQQTVQELAQASGELRALLARVDRRIDPLADAMQGTLQESRRAAATLAGALADAGDAVDRIRRAADRVSATMARFDRVADDAQPLLEGARRAADELARTAQALRSATTDDEGALPRIDAAALELARAARAVRDLADLLERQPEAILRGRSVSP